MGEKRVNVKMFGTFSIQYDEKKIDDTSNRMKKIWLLLAYLIYSRKGGASQTQYIELLQGAGAAESVNPGNKIKTMFYRVRALLNELEPQAGHQWILHKKGTYIWNPEVPVRCDVEEFEQLCRLAKGQKSKEKRLTYYAQALELYDGDFLQKFAGEHWVIPIAAYYHEMYVDAVIHFLELLEEKGKWEEIIKWSRKALQIAPDQEGLYQHLMRSLIATGQKEEAQRAYDTLSEVLFHHYGMLPSDASRSLYRAACRRSEEKGVPAGMVKEQLREPEKAAGAMYCEYDFFKLLYQVQARALPRTGDLIHIALLSLHGQFGKKVVRRSLDLAMENLKEVLLSNLRMGDIVTTCSISQMIVMLPQANYENSEKVCERLLKAFYRKYPHSPVEIQYSVQPLDSTGSMRVK